MKSFWYQIRGKASPNSREIHIDLLEGIGFFGITAKQFRQDLRMLGSTEPLHVHINSDGGDVLEGMEIFNALSEHKGNVRVSIGALAASISSYIAMAGDQISIADNGFVMIHNVWSLVQGDAKELRKVADTMDKLQANVIKGYARQTGLEEAELRQLMEEETWMSAEEALAKGFVDSIDETADTRDFAKAQAFTLTGFRNSSGFREHLKDRNMKEVIHNKGEGEDPAIREQAEVLFQAERARISEITDLVDAIKKRDKLDFSNEARKAIQEGVSPSDFSKALIKSDRFKSQFVIGAEVGADSDFLDGGGGLGALVVADEGYRRMVAQGGLPKSRSLIINLSHLHFARLRRRERFQAATPLTGLPGTGIDVLPQVADKAIQQARVADVMTQLTTPGSSVRYISETSFTNTAAPVAEGTAKPEVVFNLTEVDSPVRKIAVWTKCSDEVLADHARLSAFINSKLMAAVELALDVQLLSGSGVAPNLMGILNFTGIQTQAKGTDTQLDAIRKAITKISKNAFVPPDAVILHPDDDEDIALLKDANGQYFGGGPRLGLYGVGGYAPAAPIWGLPPIVTTAIAAGTVLVGAFRYGSELYWRQGVTLEFTNSDSDDFQKNLITVRCELRAALAVSHPIAFCQVTGM